MIHIIFGLLGGLALFIFGLKSMSDGLQKLTGKKTQKVMGILTSLPGVGVVIGILITIVTQSSTLVTVMVVGFVNTAMLNLKQAISVIIGANIGTTLTTQLVAFRITDTWIFFAAIGFAAYFIFKNKVVKNAGFVSFSLGMLLLGMSLMSQAMVPLRHDPAFQQLMLTFSDNRILAMLVGAIFTALIQSSTAATGVIVAMTMYSLIPFDAALPLVLGTNLGTTATAVLASIGGTVSARRAAMAHVLFNAIGIAIFLIFLDQYEFLILAISPENYIGRQVANAHTLFSVINAALFLPFIGLFAKLLEKIIPGEDKPVQKGPIYLDWNMADTPNVSINLAQQELIRMAEFAKESVRLSVEGLLERDLSKLEAAKVQENIVDELEYEIMRYLARVSQSSMDPDMSIRHTGLLHAANDIERISDHGDNIADLAQSFIEDGIHFSEDAIEELRGMYDLVMEIYDKAVQSAKDNDASIVPDVEALEVLIDMREKELRSSHMKRLREGACTADSGVVFLDVIINFERIGDHSNNISHMPIGKL
ncbi:MAG: Na/Pi cotransporter family protein [Oscillospiraceae bacterium]|nr:Na/Pi cotransporter family protein [Oscillospiraceae bacterium]